MTAALVVLALTAAGLAVTAALAWRSASSSKDALVAARGAQATAQIEASQIQARLVVERDEALTRAGKLAAEVADRDVKIHGLEEQLAASAAKVARLTVKLGASLPVSDEGAAIVNDPLAEPILPRSKP